MQGKHKYEPQLDLFKTPLKSLVSEKHSLVILSNKISWDCIDKEFSKYIQLKAGQVYQHGLWLGFSC